MRSGANAIKLFIAVSYHFSQHLSLASLSSLVLCLWVRPGAYPKVEYLKGVLLGQAWPYQQTLDLAGKACQRQTLQLIIKSHNLRPYTFYNIGHWAYNWNCDYKTFHARNLRMFVISWSVCSWQAFPSKSGGQPFSHSTLGQLSAQTLYQASKACHGQTLQLITNIHKLRMQKVFIIIVSWPQCYATFYVCTSRMFVVSQSVCLCQIFPA